MNLLLNFNNSYFFKYKKCFFYPTFAPNTLIQEFLSSNQIIILPFDLKSLENLYNCLLFFHHNNFRFFHKIKAVFFI